MKKIVRNSFLIVLVFFCNSFPQPANAQSAVINDLRTALKTGSSRELVKHFNNMVELNFDGDKSNYSKSQAEIVLKEFFKKYPSDDFQLIHQGASKQGLTYVIGMYTFESGSFRVLILIKKFNNAYLVDNIKFSRE